MQEPARDCDMCGCLHWYLVWLPLALAASPPLQLGARVAAMTHLPVAQRDFESHTCKASNAYAGRVADARRAQAELAIFAGHVVGDLCECAHIDQAAEQALPKYDEANDVEIGQEVKQGMQRENDKIGCLKQRRRVQAVNAHKGRRRA